MSAKEVVRKFVTRVRGGVAPREAALYLAPQVRANQVVSAVPGEVVMRSPDNYRQHVEDFLALFGPFRLELEELLADGDKVYARWRQYGHHLAEIDGFAPTGLPLITVGSAVYRVLDGKIVEYWIQQENTGLLAQLQANQQKEGA